MFNSKTKGEFLNDIREESISNNVKSNKNFSEDKIQEMAERTVEAYGRVFKTSEVIEDKYNTDLCDFTLEQIEELMVYRKPSTKASARTVGRMITKYINWSIDNEYSSLKYNPLNVSSDYFYSFVPEEKTQYLTVDQVEEVVDYLINDQDSVIVSLLFNGVQGKQASEIRNLTKGDVDFKGKRLRVKDDKTEEYRIIDFKDDRLDTLSQIKRAYKDTEYIKKNNEMEYNPHVKDTIEMPSHQETPYIVKTGKTQKKHYGERATQYTVYNRIDMIRTLEGLHELSDKLTTKNIVRSGMIYEAKRLLETEGGELDNDKLKRVCEKFNVKNHWAVRDYVNMEVIESLYGNVLVNN